MVTCREVIRKTLPFLLFYWLRTISYRVKLIIWSLRNLLNVGYIGTQKKIWLGNQHLARILLNKVFKAAFVYDDDETKLAL